MFRRRSSTLLAATGSFEWCKDRLNPGLGRSHTLLIEKGQGSYLYTEDGKKFLDFGCGIGVTNFGHCHPRLVKVVKQQVDKLWHGQATFGVNTAVRDLLVELEKILPPSLTNTQLTSTGAEAVEAALKVSRQSTGRQNTVVLQGSFHGRSAATSAMTTSKAVYARGQRPLMPGVISIPVPYPSQMHCPMDTDVEAMSKQCLAQAKDILNQSTHPSEVSMLIAEPVLGEGGYYPLPKSYMLGLQAFCKENGILFVIDEVQSGFGRTGTRFNFEQYGPEIDPDIVVFAKGIANGLPLSGIAMKAQHAAALPPGSQGGTYAGNAIACASAAEVCKIMQEKGLFDNVAARSEQLIEGIKSFVVKHKFPVLEVRGRGLMVAIQLDLECPAGTSGKLVNACTDNGLIVMNTSLYETLRLIPPLTVSEQEMSEALIAMEAAFTAVFKDIQVKASTSKFKPCCAVPCLNIDGAPKQTPCRYIGSS